MPILDLVGGFTGGLSQANQTVADLYLGIFGSTVNADGIAQAYESGDQGNIRGAVADFCVAVVGLVAAGTAVVGSGTVATAAGLVAALTGASAIMFSGVNFTAAVLSTLLQPLRAVVEIEAPASAQTAALVEVGRHSVGENESFQQLMPDGSVLVRTNVQAGETLTETVRRISLSGERTVLYTRPYGSHSSFLASLDLQLAVVGPGAFVSGYFAVSDPGQVTDIVVPAEVTGGPVGSILGPQLAGIIETAEGRWLALSAVWGVEGGVQVGFWLENTLDGEITVLPLASLGYATSGQVGFEFKVGADGWTRGIHTGGNTVSHFVFRIDPGAAAPLGNQKNIWSASGWSATPEGVFPAGQVMLTNNISAPEFTINRHGSYVSVRSRSLGVNYYPLGPLHAVFGSATDIRLNLSGTADSSLNPASETTLQPYAEYRGDSGSLVDQALLNDSGGMILHGSNGITGENYYRLRQPDGTETDVTSLLGGVAPFAAAGRYFLVLDQQELRIYRQGDQVQ
ncbi:MAG: hypothetical protein U0931_13630 [Vulcanimicrobiota bacterium]